MTSKHLCERLVDAVRYLEAKGMSVQQLRSMHHSMSRPETFRSTYRYFGVPKELSSVNVAYANRLIYVAEQHLLGRGNLSGLIEEALVRWPVATAA
jgi:hypothetical protein